MHDGKITDDRGGGVVVVRQPASTTFPGSLQNGVTSKTYDGGDFSWSFSFKAVIEIPTMCPGPPSYEEAHLYSGSPPHLYGDQVSYLCGGDTDNPETGEGPFVLVCGLDGTWKGDEPLCTDGSKPSPSPKTSVGTIVGVVIAVLVVFIAVLIAVIIIRRRCLKNDKLEDGERDGDYPVHYSDVIYSSVINIPPYPVVADQGLAEQTTNENTTYDQPANSSTAGNLLTNRGPEVQHVEPEYAQPHPNDVSDDTAHLYATVSQEEGVVDNVIYETSSCQENSDITSG
ncbi:DCBLD1 [Branchiostoma lanceolatum]|uniref:DCBLD1 protein n=1 Tax=Branchiostoma lanceolatum TaxID=7740 RepID=A0A8K0A310_BRALA|nr:DCBLD1 [Branchiostoma lanceolatum]